MHTEIEMVRRFGLTSSCKGYYLIPEAIEIARNNYERCLKITKDVYPVLAQRHGVPYERIERNIRYAIQKCWENNRAFMEEIAGEELSTYPSNSDFLDMVVYWLRDTKTEPLS